MGKQTIQYRFIFAPLTHIDFTFQVTRIMPPCPLDDDDSACRLMFFGVKHFFSCLKSHHGPKSIPLWSRSPNSLRLQHQNPVQMLQGSLRNSSQPGSSRFGFYADRLVVAMSSSAVRQKGLNFLGCGDEPL
jgi:hypothetical protein